MLNLARLCALLLVCASAMAGCAGRSTTGGPENGAPGALPPLSALPQPDTGRRVAAATDYSLLQMPPILLSTSGAEFTPGQLALDPEMVGTELPYAIFALDGFPLDESIVPLRIDVTTDAPLWFAIADYGSQRWRFLYVEASSQLPLAGGEEYISPTGVVYVAAVGHVHAANPDGKATLTELSVHTGGGLESYPTPVLTFHSATGQGAVGLGCFFSATGSDPGDGDYASISFVLDGSPPVETSDPLEEVAHMWDSPGTRTVRLTIVSKTGRSASVSREIEIVEPLRELLVVYNSEMPDSEALADYYMSVRNGRLIDPAFSLGLPLGATEEAQISRDNYGAQIRDPLRAFINDSGIEDELRYILLCKGVPHQIPGVSEFDTSSTYSSVDSELCTLFSDYPVAGWLWNGPIFNQFEGAGFYMGVSAQPGSLDDDYEFSHGQFTVSSSTQTYPLDYLVGRLSAYTFEEAQELVDRAIVADTTGSGWAAMDTIPPRLPLDTMADPVWPATDDVVDSGFELLDAAGFNVYLDTTTATLKAVGDLPPGAASALIGYCGWGTNHGGDGYPSGQWYIRDDLEFQWLPGAMWMSYESFNGTSFDNPNTRRGQGQIADFLRAGGTVAIGNAWEPFTIGVGDERVVMHRYLVRGDRWIEAAYKGLRLLSWQQVVVGDPLCQVR